MRTLRHVVARNPLAFTAVAAMTGIAAADAVAEPRLRAWCLALGLGFGCWALLKPATWRLLLCAVSGFAFIHLCRLDATRFHPLHAVLTPGQKVEAIASGAFLRAPMTVEGIDATGRRQATFQARSLQLPTLNASFDGITELRVRLADPLFIPSGGSYELHGTLTLPAASPNPSLYDPAKGAERQGFVADLSVREIIPEGTAKFSLRLWLLAIAERSRHWIEATLAAGIETEEKPRILIQTMALGTNEPGSAALQEPFRNSGTLHVFAVSGLHVSMLALIGWMILRLTGMGKQRAVLILIPLVVGYAFITGWKPSAARAAMMSCALLCAPFFDRKSRPVNALGGCALVLLGFDTQQLFQAGFQLSFGVVWAIASFTRPATRPLEKFASLDPFLPVQLATAWQRFGVWARREMIAIFVVSVIATLASLPIMLAEFHNVAPVGIIANCVLVPLSFISLLTVVLSLIAGGLHCVTAQVLFNNANWLFVKTMTVCAAWFASLPAACFNVSWQGTSKPPPAILNVLAMPPGEAAQMLESNGQRWLLDCGGARHEPFTLLPFLRNEGVNKLNGVILSHGDADHIGAMTDLMERFSPQVVMTSLHEPWRLDSRITLMHKLFSSHALDAARTLKLQAGDVLPLGAVRLRVLYPSAADLYNKADDRALVAVIECGKMRVLWCNDAGFITEKHLIARFPARDLHCQVLVRNQHASDYSALAEFLSVVNPRLIISSDAPGITEQRMPDSLKQYCASHHVTLFNQAESGMARLELWQDHLEAKAWLTGFSVSIQP